MLRVAKDLAARMSLNDLVAASSDRTFMQSCSHAVMQSFWGIQAFRHSGIHTFMHT